MAAKAFLNAALTISLFFLVWTVSAPAHAKIIYVDDDAAGANDGSSWTDAYNYLQDALLAAASGDEICAAQGIYTPIEYTPSPPPLPPPPPPPFPTNFSNSQSRDATPFDRTIYFYLKNGVSLKGGYAGAGYPDPNARDIEIYETILSGDLNGDDDTVGMNDNSFCVVKVSDNAGTKTVLDGFVITAGFVETEYYFRYSVGAGLSTGAGSPVISNCTIRGNHAEGYYACGAGLWSDGGSPVVTDCRFIKNTVVGDGAVGAGVFIYSGSPLISNCIFRDNHAEGYYACGAGIWSDGGSPVITDCRFIQNTVVGDDAVGAGVFIYSGSPVISNCIFRDNHAEGPSASGAGLWSWKGEPVVTDCEFIENTTVGDGSGGAGVCASIGLVISNCTFRYNHVEGRSACGAGLLSYYGGIVVTDCEFIENTAVGDDPGGAGLWNYHGNITVTDCSFINNFASGRSPSGAGMESHKGISTITRCTFIGNHGPMYGGGLYTYSGSPNVTSCLFVDNSAKYGGGFANYEGQPNIVNCTFTLNTAEERGGGIRDYTGKPTIINTILWANSDGAGSAGQSQIFSYCGSPLISHSWIAKDPLFFDPQNGDYRLRDDSPCINAGDPNYVAEPNEKDLDGKPRIIAGRIDMGAYEYGQLVSAEARFTPRTINLASKGNWINCYIWLPDEYNVADIEPNSVLLEGDIQPEQFSVDEQEQVATAIFSRDDVLPILEVGDIELKITGQLSHTTYFEAADTIKVINPKLAENP